MATVLQLPVIDFSSEKKLSAAESIRQACMDHGFFYVKNHGVPEELIEDVFRESNRFFSLPLEEKMGVFRVNYRGYSPLYDEKLDLSDPNRPRQDEKLDSSRPTRGDPKETFCFGSSTGDLAQRYPNQWPDEDILPSWRSTMECYYKSVLSVGRKLLGLIALALNLDENYFEQIGAYSDGAPIVRLLHYPGELVSWSEETYGASAHTDLAMITLLASDGVPGLQVCRDKSKEARVWEDVPGVRGAFVVNIGDLMERWTNGLFRSTLHRVIHVGKERYSVAFFLDPHPDCVVKCLECCCSETCPPRFPPIRAEDYYDGQFSLTYGRTPTAGK
ncbi:PREDICTED: 2-oxoglutarate-Fe(II) type oxidoreductase [Tarenaya hassleriana]|uniref:2-oxoglutarate-Fe(II) type oxidoreductase n=1 Tax=Tarenaya hassleriana TaxID=28532 RepID=UPI00053C6098|nr:PREDICTED: 2-oxoglutarate-Fe(II) type oxidoreductase [Tarenaya hassleriana]